MTRQFQPEIPDQYLQQPGLVLETESVAVVAVHGKLLITGFIKEDSPVSLTHAITRL